ncbi:MAG: hypothetical protein ACRDO0_14545, partial [Nocardioidaceae bacterium]
DDRLACLERTEADPGGGSHPVDPQVMALAAGEVHLLLHEVAERLTVEFPALPVRTVVGILSQCAEDLPRADSLFVEEAARSKLRVLRAG